MRGSTKLIHDHVAALGELLGFDVGREVSDSLLKVRLDESYQPRVDLLWSLPLDTKKRDALTWALGSNVTDVAHMPVAGIEVEGTTPSSKTMAADVANITALGAPLGLLVISERGEHGIYGRAARVIRSVRRAYGDLSVLPVEADWIPQLMSRDWDTTLAPTPPPKTLTPAGGETLSWSRETREKIRRMGEGAGFAVAEPLVPRVLEKAYELANSGRAERLRHMRDPLAREVVEMSKAGDYLTKSQLDIAWLMPLPKSLSDFLEALAELDPCLHEHAMLFPDLWTHIPVVAFELESGSGKHTGGGLLNLGAHSVLGVVATQKDASTRTVEKILRTYRPTLGLRNVFARTFL